MIGEAPAGDPVLPVVGCPDEPLVRVLIGDRGRVLAPRQRYEARLAFLNQRAREGARALEAEPHIRRQRQARLRRVAPRDGLVIAETGVLPAGALPAVVERGVA